MTIQEVKQVLPPVLGRREGRLYWCRVSGRLNQFATVCLDTLKDKPTGRRYLGPCFEVAWSTVARCIDENKPIALD